MARYAIVNTTTGLVENVVEYAQAPGTPPPDFAANYVAVQSDQASIGWTYSGGALSNPNPPASIPLSIQADAALRASDVSMLRVLEATALGKNQLTNADVVSFVNWRRGLRAISDGTDTTSTSLPARPAYPAGT